MSKERIFGVDSNWYLHRAYHTMHTNQPIEIAMPYRLVGMICGDALATKSQYVCAAFDGPKVFRHDLFPMYKSGRNGGVSSASDAENADASEQDVYRLLPHIYDLFAKIGLVYYQPRTYEADDVLRSIVAKYSKKYSIVAGTIDKDAYQYLKPGVRLYNPSAKDKAGNKKPVYITHEDADRKFGVPANRMVDYQTLVGDKIDSIPPIPGYGPDRAKKVIEQFATLQDWYAQSTGDLRVFIRAHMEDLRRNRKLVELSTECVPPHPISEWRLPKTKPEDKYLPRAYHDYHAFLYPKSKGLF